MKRIFIVSTLTGMLLASMATGCASTETPPAPPITSELSFPDGAPPLNQEAELIYIMEVMEPGCVLENMSIEIRLPEGFELVSGELSWFGDISSGDELEVIRATVRAVQAGNWTIESRCAINPETQCGISIVPGWHPTIYVSVFEDSAEWGKYPPWYEGDGEVPIEVVDETSSPIVDLSISHAPLVDEPAEITCTIKTLIDYPNMNVQIELTYGDALALVDGSLEWHGNLIANVPVTFSAQVAFTRSGYYNIGWRVRQTGQEYSWVNPRVICLLIGEDESSFCEEPPLILPPSPE